MDQLEKKYDVLLEQDEHEQMWTASVPEVPGAVTQAKSQQSALAEIKAVLIQTLAMFPKDTKFEKARSLPDAITDIPSSTQYATASLMINNESVDAVRLDNAIAKIPVISDPTELRRIWDDDDEW